MSFSVRDFRGKSRTPGLAFAALPPHCHKSTDSRHPNLEPFGAQKFTFELEIATVAAKRSAGRNDSMARDARVAAFTHDGADRAPRAWRSGQCRDIPVSRDASRRDASHCAEHALSK
jgi:hypothetical protein